MDARELKSLFGRRVRDLRKREGYTQEELAEAVGLSVEYISKIERGLASPSFAVIADLCNLFGDSPIALFETD